MGYITFRTEKIKTSSGLSVSHAHNQREGFCENADASRKFMNKQLMPCAQDYNSFLQDRLNSSPLFANGQKTPREDAVKALELVFRVSAEEMDNNPYFDLDRFCEITKQWVCDTFGADNVADLVLHMDEGYGEHEGSLKCAPHIHAVVIPMTKDGRLSASEFIGSPKKLQAMQSEVAEQYKELKLKRGLHGSVAKPHEMRDFYGWVHAARTVNLPEPRDNETARQYAMRIRPEVQKIQSQNLKDSLDLQRERDEALTRLKQLQGGTNQAKDEIEQTRMELEKREQALQTAMNTLQKDREALQQWRDVSHGLTSSRISREDYQTFMRIAGVALQEGRATREQEERQQSDNTHQSGTIRSEMK